MNRLAPDEQALALPPPEAGILSNARNKLAAVIAAGALVCTGALAADMVEPSQAIANPVPTGTLSPEALSQQASLLVVSTAKAWAGRQTSEGRFIDPVLGGNVKTYGAAMIGQAMVETGVALNDETLVESGIKALSAQTKNPDNDGFNVGFEVFGMSDAVAWNDTVLANNPNWQNTRPGIVNFLQERSTRPPSGIVGKAFESGTYSNLRLVQALAKVGLSAAGINTPAQAQAASAGNEIASATSANLLARAVQNTSRDARRLGGMRFDRAGIISDPTANPLAYNSLSAMLLGRIIQKQGYENASPAVRAAFNRSAKAIVGLMGPNGDVSFVGRGQGQVWNLAATADALASAARFEQNPEWKGRFLGGYARVIGLLRTDYTPGPHGMPVIPRHKGEAHPSRKGLEKYVSTVGYNGLALNALLNSINTLKQVQPALNRGIAADYNGVFIDPSQAKFATVRRGGLWWAIHGSTTNKDGRYGFGIMAAQRVQSDDSAKNIMPHRPYTGDKTASGGPVLKRGGREFVPVAQRMSAKANGIVRIIGGWSATPNQKPAVDRDTKMTFQPRGNNAISFGFVPKRNQTYEFEVWAAKGAKANDKNSRGITLTEPDGDRIKHSFNRPVKITRSPGTDYSSYDKLDRYTMTVKAKAGKKLEQTTTFG